MLEEYGAIWDPENFTFTYKMNGETYELYDEQQILYALILLMPIDTTDFEILIDAAGVTLFDSNS